MINTVKAHWKKLLGILWLFVAYTLVARAIALFRVDALDLPKHDPSSLEFWFGLFIVMLSLPYLLCAAGLLAKWRGNLRWVVLPALLLFVAAYSLRVTLNWHAA